MTGSFQYPWGTTRPAALEKSIASARDALDRREADIPGQIEAYRKQLDTEIAAERADLDARDGVLAEWHRSRETAVAGRRKLKAWEELQSHLTDEEVAAAAAALRLAPSVPPQIRPSPPPTAQIAVEPTPEPVPPDHGARNHHAHVLEARALNERLEWFEANVRRFETYSFDILYQKQPSLNDTAFGELIKTMVLAARLAFEKVREGYSYSSLEVELGPVTDNQFSHVIHQVVRPPELHDDLHRAAIAEAEAGLPPQADIKPWPVQPLVG